MWRTGSLLGALSSLLWAVGGVAAQTVVQVSKDGSPNDPGLARYVSRPDIRAPKWDFHMHDAGSNSPGYWFVAPYRGINGEQADQPWVGPFIYDGGNGELVWSGGADFVSNVADFRISNINGEQLMTLFASNHIVTLNNDYTIRQALAPETQGPLNTHELNFVDNGTRALILRNDVRRASRQESQKIGFEGECIAQFDTIDELDVTQDGWPSVFQWNPYGRIDFEESTYMWGNVADRCKRWDHLHVNSLDKIEGDYILSARHTDTIYKISGTDKSILWRLVGRPGAKSDFRMDDVVFTRQHDVRYRGRNDTHIWLSFLDNSRGEDYQPASHPSSRGLLVAIDEANMVATLEAHYDHPRPGSLSQRRGNYQMLPNGNVMMGWSERAMQSEYTPEGKLVWEAILQVDWMGSYRNYKFEHVGKPADPPTAVSRAYDSDGTVTDVHVSWNGATEVANWELYRTTANGSIQALIASESKLGFETRLTFEGYAKYVLVVAKDRAGHRIGITPVIQTVTEASLSGESLAEGEQWVQDVEYASAHAVQRSERAVAVFFAGAICGMMLLFAFRNARPSFGMWRRLLRPGHQYTAVAQV